MTPFIIALAGGSGAGKSTLAGYLCAQLAPDAALLSEDQYYHCRTRFPAFDADTHDFDCPEAKDFTLLSAHLARLRAGQSVAIPHYDLVTHTRTEETMPFAPRPVIILEGILAFIDEGVRKHVDLSVWLDAPTDIRLERRVERDVKTRGRTGEGVRAQFSLTVEPALARYAPLQIAKADLVIDSCAHQHDLAAMAHLILQRMAPEKSL